RARSPKVNTTPHAIDSETHRLARLLQQACFTRPKVHSRARYDRDRRLGPRQAIPRLVERSVAAADEDNRHPTLSCLDRRCGRVAGARGLSPFGLPAMFPEPPV